MKKNIKILIHISHANTQFIETDTNLQQTVSAVYLCSVLCLL